MVNLKGGDLCPICEEGTLREEKKDLSFTYKGRTKTFKAQKILVCSACEHEAFSKTAGENIDRELADFRRTIDGLLTSRELREIRLNLGLKKKQMAELLSVNAKTIGRYENNRITQSEQVDKLYRIFRSFPLAAEQLAKSKELVESIEQRVRALSREIFLCENATASISASKGTAVSSGSGMLAGIEKIAAPSAYTTYLRREGLAAA
jgi:putative zinc finger/helix-turn-helix YgiT family protein